MRRFSEMDRVRVGIVGGVVVVLLLSLAVNVGKIKSMIVGSEYSAVFAEAGGLRVGDDVRISGYRVGQVESVDLDGDRVQVEFTSDGPSMGTATGAAIKTETALGTKLLALNPAGDGEMEAGDQIPVRRTNSPYDVTEAMSDLTATTGQIDVGKLAQSFDTLSQTFSGTKPELRGTLDGVARLSRSIASRDDALRDVLAKAKSITGVLSERSTQITQLMTDGNALLSELQNRRDTFHQLLVGVRTATDQLTGLVQDNRDTLRPALDQLHSALGVLNKNVGNIEKAIQLLGAFGRSLGEAVGGGPFFYAYLSNLPPTNLVPLLPSLFGVGQPPGYGQPPPATTNPPPGGNRPSPPDQQPYFPVPAPPPPGQGGQG